MANTADLEFMVRALPVLHSSVDLGERILEDENLSPGVRIIAEKAVARPQDEIIQLNELKGQWGNSPLDLETHAKEAMQVTDPTGAKAVPQSQGDLQHLNDSWGGEHELTYLLLLRQQLGDSIELAEELMAEGESLRLRDIAEQMVQVKSRRINEIDEYLNTVNEEPRELR
ncbi:DUF305 domain-containing protein [Corynebacterium occultum]|nr:DUF305 domain-containing protein [Corynebacterium occultum]